MLGVGAVGAARRAARTRRRRSAPARAVTARRTSSSPKPTGPGGLPLPRPDNAVTWAITDDNQPIADGVADEGGPLGIYNYADYIDPGLVKKFEKLTGRKVADRDLQLGRRGDREARLRRGRVRRDHRAHRREHRQPDRAAADPAAQPLVPDERREEHLAGAAGPVLRPWQQLHGAVLVWSDGIGWRNDKIDVDIAGMKVPWDIFWESQPWQGQGRDPRRQARRARDADAAGRDAHRPPPRPQHRGRRRSSRRPARTSSQLTDISNVKVDDHRTTRRCPEGKTWLHQSWSGDLLSAAFYYMPKGVPPTRALVLEPGDERRRPERLLLHRPHGEEPGARAPVHQLHARREERVRQHGQLRRLRRLRRTRITAESLIKSGLIPKSLTRAVVRPEQFPFNQELLQLSVAGRALLGRGLVEVQGRLTDGLALDLAAARASRASLWLTVFFLLAFYAVVAVAFGNQNTLSEPVPFWNPLDWNVGYMLADAREHLARRASSSPSSCARSSSSRSRSRSRS